MIHFSHVSDSPYSDKFLRLPEFFFPILPFPYKFRFSSANIYDDLFSVLDYRIQNSPPIFPNFLLFLPISRKLLFPSYFYKFPPVFGTFTCFFYILYVYFVPPTLAMMHCCITQCTYWTALRQ